MANPRAAEWRDVDGRVVKTTTDELYCLNPRYPRDLAARTEDGEFEVGMRCRDCANCRRYEALQLRRELAETYREVTDDLWIITIEAALTDQSRVASRVHRSGLAGIEPCLYRLGVSAFAMVARGHRPDLSKVRALRTRAVRVVPIGPGRRPRDFKPLTRGLLVERAYYENWRNRYYHRGRARVPRETFINETRGGIRKRHPEAKGGVRAFRRGLSLMPSLRTQAIEFMALILKRDGALNRRKCTHSKCEADRCRYKSRAPIAALPVNQAARGSAPSPSLNDRNPDCSAAHGAQGDPATGITGPFETGGAATFAPKDQQSSNSGGRDAGSLQKGGGWIAEMRERWIKKGWLKPDTS